MTKDGFVRPCPREDEADVRRFQLRGASMAWDPSISYNSALVFSGVTDSISRAARGRVAREEGEKGKGAPLGRDAARTQRSGWSTVRTFQALAPARLVRESDEVEPVARLDGASHY